MGFILGLILILMIAGCIALIVSENKRYNKSGKKKSKNTALYLLTGVLFIAFIFVPFGFKQVKTGEIAVVKVWGEAKDVRTAGLHFRNVVSTDYELYDLKTQEITESIEAYSLDAQVMTASIAIQYSILSDKVIDINTKYGNLEVLNNRIKAICLEKAKVVLSSKSAMNLIETRSSISQNVETELIANTSEYYIAIEMVAITDIAFNDAFETAVENKMIAEQEKLKAEYDKEKAIIKAEEELAVSIKQAEAAIETAKGEKQAQIEIATAQAEATRLKAAEIARMMGFEISEEGNIIMDNHSTEEVAAISAYLKYIEYLEKWDGELPQTYVTGDTGSSIIINPNP